VAGSGCAERLLGCDRPAEAGELARTGDDNLLVRLAATGHRGLVSPLLPRALTAGETIVCDKGYAGREFAGAVDALGAIVARPPRTNRDPPARPRRLHQPQPQLGRPSRAFADYPA